MTPQHKRLAHTGRSIGVERMGNLAQLPRKPSILPEMWRIEQELGRNVFTNPGDAPFDVHLHLHCSWPAISWDRKRAFILAVEAQCRGLGLMDALASSIRKTGRTPIIVGPISGHMRGWLLKRRYKRCPAVCGDRQREEWRPAA